MQPLAAKAGSRRCCRFFSASFASARIALLVGAVMLGLMVGVATPAAAKVFSPETYRLGNGLQVILIRNHRAPVVAQMLWYCVGSADERPDQEGLAHYLEHLMFLGNAAQAPGEYSRRIAEGGGDENAFTSRDYTAYFAVVRKDQLAETLLLEAERMQSFSPPLAAALNERDVVREERRQRTENNPEAQLAESVQAELYPHHPYGRPTIGSAEAIAALTPAAAAEFHQTHYRPENAILILSGDVTAKEALPLIAATFGRIAASPIGAPTAGTLAARQRVAVTPLTAPQQVNVRDTRVGQEQWHRLYQAPSFRTAADKRMPYALQVLAEIIGNPDIGRFYESLARRQNLAAAVSADYDMESWDSAAFSVSVTPRPGVSLAAIEAATKTEIARFLKNGVTEKEVAAARTRLAREAVFSRDHVMAPAYAFGMALATGQKIADVEAWPARIRAVTAAEIMTAARKVFGQEGYVTARLQKEEP